MAIDGSILPVRTEELESPPEGPQAAVEPQTGGIRRALPDRRQQPTPRLSRYFWSKGRRREIRRDEEREGSFVDLYGSSVVISALIIALFNVGDSYFTLVHLQAGGIELNPVAERLLRTGRMGFVFWKSVVIGVALMVLVLHKNFVLARLGLWLAAAAYGLLVLYHLYLLTI